MATARKNDTSLQQNEMVLDDACSFNEVIRIISPQWKMQVLFSIYSGVNRFGQLKKEYETLSDEMLAKRLRELTSQNFIERIEGDDLKHPNIHYALTPKAKELLRIVPYFCAWGDRWLR